LIKEVIIIILLSAETRNFCDICMFLKIVFFANSSETERHFSILLGTAIVWYPVARLLKLEVFAKFFPLEGAEVFVSPACSCN